MDLFDTKTRKADPIDDQESLHQALNTHNRTNPAHVGGFELFG